MKRWAALTVLLYTLALLALSSPAVLIGFGGWANPKDSVGYAEVVQMYAQGWFWTWLGITALGQVLLLLIPVSVAERRPVPRRPLVVPLLTIAFLLATLFFGGAISLICLVSGDHGPDVFGYLGELVWSDPLRKAASAQLMKSAPGVTSPTLDYVFGAFAVVMALWLVWGLVFYRFARNDDPEALMKRGLRWLVRGSVLELLVAVPSHIVARNRNDCCAPVATFWGITAGLSIMLMCFGPGVFFLFVERMDRLRAKSKPAGQPPD